MAAFIRVKRVTDPLDDKAKARLYGGDATHPITSSASSSGSEHDATCLSGLVHAFLECSDPTPSAAADSDSDSDSDEDATVDPPASPTAEMMLHLLNPPAERDRFRTRLLADVSGAAETLTLSGLRTNPPAFRRAVVGQLRATGYNAGLCKARWEASGGLTAGTHEYIDVVREWSPAQRYVVDVDFAAEFEIARPTAEYETLVAALPRVAVARAEEVRRAVRFVADAAQRSLRCQGLSVPPWRKSRYMVAKWAGPYRRTVNPLPAAVSGGGAEIKCRSVGFQAVPGLIAARTR